MYKSFLSYENLMSGYRGYKKSVWKLIISIDYYNENISIATLFENIMFLCLFYGQTS